MKFANYSSEEMIEIKTKNGLEKMFPQEGTAIIVEAISYDLPYQCDYEHGDCIMIGTTLMAYEQLPSPKNGVMFIVDEKVHRLCQTVNRVDTVYHKNGKLMI